MRFGTLTALAWLIGALLPLQVSAQQMQLVIVELQARSADEVIPLLEPMLAQGGTISGLKDKLAIRTTPANLAELRKILDLVDARPRRLLITVKQSASALDDDRDIEISGTVGNDRVHVEVSGSATSSATGAVAETRRKENHVRSRVTSTQSNQSRQTLQTLQVLEGNSAFISLGESIPVHDRTTAIGAGAVVRSDSTRFREVVSGFYARPRISGAQVTVQLAATADTVLNRETGAVHIQRVSSVVSGRIGEWMEVGGVVENADRIDTGAVTYRSSTGTDERRTYIKVEELR